jgi:glutathione S-transferase
MEVYFSPLACSLSARITLYEAGAAARFVEVDPKTKRTADGVDYRTVNTLGLVPALRTDEGRLITENAAILQYLAGCFPAAGLAPATELDRTAMRTWLSFVGTELHKALYVPLLDPKAPEGAKSYALGKADARLSWLAAHLEGREYLLASFSVADAYLFTVLNWSTVVPVDLGRWPALTAYMARLKERPAVARALAEERQLYAQEQARHAR